MNLPLTKSLLLKCQLRLHVVYPDKQRGSEDRVTGTYEGTNEIIISQDIHAAENCFCVKESQNNGPQSGAGVKSPDGSRNPFS